MIKMGENKSSRVLSNAAVIARRPCDTYRDWLNERYPVSVEVTVDLAVAQAEDWDWFWAAKNLLTAEGFDTWRAASAKADTIYIETMKPYRDLMTQAYEDGDAAIQVVRNARGSWAEQSRAWDRAAEVARAAQGAAHAVADKHYQEAVARAFAEIFIAEGADSAELAEVIRETCSCGTDHED